MKQRYLILFVASVVLLGAINVLGWMIVSDSLAQKATIRESERLANAGESSSAVSRTAISRRTSVDTPYKNSPSVNVGPSADLKVKAVERPDLCLPGETNVLREAQVVGVEVNGQPIAYVIEAFNVHEVSDAGDLSVHVVSDVVGGRPFCVTYCNKTHSTRVFTRDTGETADDSHLIDLRVGGWNNGMVLVLEGRRYQHHSRNIPLKDMQFVTTSWQQWLSNHPDTLVYTGKRCRRSACGG